MPRGQPGGGGGGSPLGIACVASISMGFSAFSEVWLRVKWGKSKTKMIFVLLSPHFPRIRNSEIGSGALKTPQKHLLCRLLLELTDALLF